MIRRAKARQVSSATISEAITTVGEHYSVGRLSDEEYNSRLDRLEQAETTAEVRTVFTDLPGPHPDLGQPVMRPYSGTLRMIGFLFLLFGTPAAAVIGFTIDAWWPLLAVVLIWIVSSGVDSKVADHIRRTQPQASSDQPTTSELGALRLSNGDRELAVVELEHHRDAGQLELFDYEDRIAAVSHLIRRRDMERLFDDLPEPHPNLAHVVPPEAAQRAELRHSVSSSTTTISFADATVVALAVVGLPTAIIVGIRTGQWFWLPIDVVAFVLLCLRGPAPSLVSGSGRKKND